MSIRWQQIRAAAAALRDAYTTETGLVPALPLPLDDLAERVHLLTVCEDPTLDPRIDGELNPALGSIRLKPGMPPARRRFVVAHELGHFVLEGADQPIYADDDTTLDERGGGEREDEPGAVRAYNTRERHEQEANRFALELLIPADALWAAARQPGWTVAALARTFGVSSDALRAQLVNVCCIEPPIADAAPHGGGHVPPDPNQQAAIDARLPTLVVAGPGTGKTRTIVAKYLSLVTQGVDPAHILALTFSNRAAEEMRGRIVEALRLRHPTHAERVEVSTFHAWGLNVLKQYGPQLGLPPAIQLRAPGDLYVLLRRRLADLPLDQYKDLRDPAMYLGQIVGAISRAKDELCDPPAYRRLAEAEGARLVAEAERANAGKTTKAAQEAREKAARDAARLRELAAIYARYEDILREEGVLDYGDLIVRAVALLALPQVAADLRARHRYILVDEFQDINYASGELVRLLDGGHGRVWAVGDPWQSIYRFRGASPFNLLAFPDVYAGAETRRLDRNYRSFQAILDASHAVMAPDPLHATRGGLTASRAQAGQVVVEWVAADAQAEASAIARDILRRVRGAADDSAPAPGSPRFGDHAVLCRTHTQAALVAATLQAHGVPVDQAGELFDAPEVKDALAVVAMVGEPNSAGTLRALTMPEHALDPADMTALVQQAHETRQALPRAARDEAIVARLSRAGQHALATLHAVVDALGQAGDAWQVLTHYLFEHSAMVRAQITAAAQGSYEARRGLAALGQLVGVAHDFVRQAPPDERGPSDLIAYIRLLIAAGERITAVVPGGQVDVVQVMTVHAAKGLEFPAVYVPGVQESVFPSRKQRGSIPALPALVHGAPAGELDEERYLLYVAMTRARDRLVLSRAATKNERPVKRSPLLPGGPDGAAAPWPVVVLPATQPDPAPAQPVRLTVAPVMRTPIPASSLEAYARCPRSYLYQYGYQLYDDLSPYLRTHQTIRDVVQDLTQRARTGMLPADADALRELTWEVFAGHGLEGALYADDYFAEALRHITQVWRDLSGGTYAPDAVDRRYVVRRPAGEVAVRVDRVEPGANGPRWVRTRSGRERADDHLSTPITLYALAHLQEHGTPGEIALHYTATGAVRAAAPRPAVLDEHTAAIDRLLAGIQAGDWHAAVGPQCDTCPFNLICPA